MTTATLAGLLLASVLGARAAIAQTNGIVDDRGAPAGRHAEPRYNPNEGLQPNGCVKLCPLDTNPCDPPQYKKADGRCNLRD